MSFTQRRKENKGAEVVLPFAPLLFLRLCVKPKVVA